MFYIEELIRETMEANGLEYVLYDFRCDDEIMDDFAGGVL